MSRLNTDPQAIEARRIAAEHGLVIFEKPSAGGGTVWLVKRKLPDGRATFLGKRGTPAGLRRYVARLANVH